MGLTSSLLIGQSALAASQLALQVTGNNIANVGTKGYHRQSALLTPVRGGQESGRAFIGRGVRVSEVRRAIDPALQDRLRNGISDEQSASIDRSVLSQVESLMNELTGNDVSSELGKFFSAFSELANNPSAAVTRSSVVEQGASLASRLRQLRSSLVEARRQIESQLSTNVNRADTLLDQIADLNQQVVTAELGKGTDGSLRDQRDALIDELSGLLDVTVIEQKNGSVDLLAGSTPILLGSKPRGLELDIRTVNNELEVRVLVQQSQESIGIDSGTIGGLLRQRDAGIQGTIDDLDSLAANLIFEVNKLHSQGRPQRLITDTTGWQVTPSADQARAFNDPANATFAALPFAPSNGSFEVVISDANGNKTRTTISVDLDGIDNSGAAGTADDTSLTTLTASLNGVANLHAQITSDGRLRLYTDAGYDVSFDSDTSGAMAALGVNSFFQGQDAGDIDVRSELRADPLKLSVGLGDGTNETALGIAQLRDRSVQGLGGDTLGQSWLKTVQRTAVAATAASTRAEAASTVRQSLEAQDAAVSGVSLDEESINLINYQQQYASAARFIGVVNDLTQILLQLV